MRVPDAAPRPVTPEFLIGGGDMGAMMRSHDWSSSPLGCPSEWPQSLRSVVGLLLNSRFPMFVAWGDELAFLYNDAYAEVLGAKHPAALGRRFHDIWTEIWSDISPLIDAAMAGQATYRENLPLLMNRKGYDEQTWFTFSYSPVRDESGAVAGMFCACTETTAQVVAERRQAFLIGLEERLRGAGDARAAMQTTVDALGRHLGASRVGYSEVRADGETIDCATCYADGVAPLLGTFSLADFGPESIARQQRGETEACPDTTEDPAQVHRTWARIDTRAFLSVPLIRDGRMRASLYVNFARPHRWTPEEVALAEEVAARSWAAVERARAEAALRESEQQFRLMADSVPQIVWITDGEGRTLFFNRQWFDFTGRRYEPSTAEDIAAGYIHPDDVASTMAAFEEARRTGGAFDVEHRIRSRDGSYRWFLVRAEPYRDPATGEILRWFGSSTDIHARREIEAALAESEARFRNMADYAPVMMWVTDPSGACTYLNARWYEFTGQAPGAGEGYGWLDAVHPEDRAQAEQAFLAANAERRDVRLEFRLRRADGAYRWTIDAAAPRSGAKGEHLGYVGSVIDIDARREMETALRYSEERLRLALEGAGLGTWDWDLRTLRGTWSPRTMEILGVDDGEAVTAERRTQTIHPDDRERVWREFSEAVEKGDELRSEYRVLRPDGEVRWIASRGAVQRDAIGEPVRAAGIVLDVTGQRAAEAALRQLNETLERRVAEALAERKILADVVGGTDAFVQVVDPDFRWMAINKAAADEFERIYGRRPTVGASMLELLADLPEHQAAVREIWTRALGGEEFTLTAEFGDPALERRVYEIKHNVLRDADGRQIGAYQFVYDVTERTQEQAQLAAAEAARREADALYRAYFEHTAEALFVVDVLADGGFAVADLNPAHQASIGMPLSEVLGKRLDEILPPETAAPIQAHYRRAIAADSVYQYREAFEVGGRPTYWDTVLVPVRDGLGRIVRLIGSSRDLTAQVAAEEQLRQSQKLEAMGSLVGGVAHDVNNLLSPIVGGLDLLQRRGVGDERAQRLVSGAMQSAERARVLVQRLLAFARRQPLQPMPIDLGQVVAGMADLVASTSGPRVAVAVDVAPDLPAVLADANQLEMAILNLSVNARDAMPDGGKLTIAAAAEEVAAGHRAALPPGRYVRLSVSDSGIGMDETTLARAIEPFFSTKGVGQGTGLGLSMVHGLAAQLGGGLSIRSRPGLGTSVELWLPVAAAAGAGPRPEAETPAKAAAGTALVVDDEELVRTTTGEMLADMGFRVVEAGSADAALRMIDGGLNPDIVVTDHLMPGLTGTQLARLLPSKRPGTPVLIVSGYADVEGIAPDLARLEKPFTRAELAAAIAKLSKPAPQARD